MDGGLWHCTGGSDQDHSQEKEKQKGTTAEKRREAKGKGEKERYTHLNAECQRIARKDKKAFLCERCKEIEENMEWERLEIASGKLEIAREHFVKDEHNKGQKW